MAVHYHQGRFPPARIDWPALLDLIGPAHAAVARYEGLLRVYDDWCGSRLTAPG